MVLVGFTVLSFRSSFGYVLVYLIPSWFVSACGLTYSVSCQLLFFPDKIRRGDKKKRKIDKNVTKWLEDASYIVYRTQKFAILYICIFLVVWDGVRRNGKYGWSVNCTCDINKMCCIDWLLFHLLWGTLYVHCLRKSPLHSIVRLFRRKETIRNSIFFSSRRSPKSFLSNSFCFTWILKLMTNKELWEMVHEETIG